MRVETPHFFISEVGLLGTAATTGLLYQPQMIGDGDCGEMGGMKIDRGNRSTRRKPAPAPLCLPKIPHHYTRVGPRAAAVASQRLTAWAMARPTPHLLHQIWMCVIYYLLWLESGGEKMNRKRAYFRADRVVFHWAVWTSKRHAMSTVHSMSVPLTNTESWCYNETGEVQEYEIWVLFFTVIKIHIAVFWVMTSSCLVRGYERCGGIYCFHLQRTLSWRWRQ
jgi:hypothetical protein